MLITLGISPWLALLNFIPALIALLYIKARRGTYDPFEPATFVFLPYAIIPMIAGIHILLNGGDPNAAMPEALDNIGPSAYLLSAVIHIAALLIFLVGYNLNVPPLKVSRLAMMQKKWPANRTYLVIGFFILLSVFATYKLAQTFGITSFALDYLSKKRFYDVGDNVASAALGYTAWLTDYGRYALMAALAYIVTQRRKIRLIHIAILVMIFLVAATPLVLKSSRSAVFFLMLSCAVVHHYGRKRISFSALSAFAVAGFMILVIMGGLRSSRGTLELNFSPAGIVETVGARDGVGFSLLAKIVTDMPEAWDYQMGKTYVAWVFAPVPRSLWSEKPIISLGQEVKVELFGRAPERGGGIPPKSVGELFINFGYFSIPLLLPWFLAAGVVCKSVYRTFIRQETPGPFLVFAYAIVLIEIIPSIFVGQFSGNMVSLIKMSITLWILMFAFVLKLRIRNT